MFIISSNDGNQRLEQKVTYLRNTAFPAPNTEDTVQTITLMPRDGMLKMPRSTPATWTSLISPVLTSW